MRPALAAARGLSRVAEATPGEAAAAVARDSYGRLIAYLAARSHDIAAAEDALGDAFAAALRHWPVDGVPDAPEAWLLTTARRRLHDRWRHGQVEAGAEETLRIVFGELATVAPEAQFPDERLKLMFVCAHPAIDPAARSALMLQTVLGLDAARIASAFLVAPATLAQRLVRAKTKIRAAGIAFEVPREDEWPERLADVLEAIYAAYGTGWDDVAGTDPQTSGLAQRGADAGGDAGAARSRRRRSVGAGRADRLLPVARRGASQRRRRLRSARGAGPGELGRRAARGRRGGAAEGGRARRSRRVPDRGGDPVGAHPAPARRERSRCARSSPSTTRWSRSSRRSARASAAPARSARPMAPRPAWPRSRRSRPRDVRGYQPYWAALAHLAAAAGHAETASVARERAVGLSTDPAVRRFLAQGA